MANGVAMRAIKTQRRPAALAGALATGGLAGATGLGVALTAVSGLGAAAPGVAVTAVSDFSGGGGLLGALGVVSDMIKTILNSGGKSERPRYSVYEAMGSFLVPRSWTVNPCVRKERGAVILAVFPGSTRANAVPSSSPPAGSEKAAIPETGKQPGFPGLAKLGPWVPNSENAAWVSHPSQKGEGMGLPCPHPSAKGG